MSSNLPGNEGTRSVEINALLSRISEQRDYLVQVTRELVRLPSETPPSNTKAVAAKVASYLRDIENVEVTFHTSEEPIANMVAVVKSGRPGKRLVLNGHLDTYPVGDEGAWSEDPFSGAVHDGKIFGRGSADMKGGVACSLMAFLLLAKHTQLWSGELVLALAGDEESMGLLGSQYLLDTVAMVRGDAMLCADVGSPTVPRVGEKGMIWIDVFASGRPAHGAHVHRGINAIDRLRMAMDSLEKLADYPVDTPDEVAKAIAVAKPVSEPLGGMGEASVLQKVTVNYGKIAGGQTANLVADSAEFNADIRLPMGVSVAEIEIEIERMLIQIEGISYKITRRFEPSWTPSDDAIVEVVTQACDDVLGLQSVVNMRVGASDARLFRAAGIPTVVCGLTPNNLGGPDEYVEIDELESLAKIQTLAAINFLNPDH